MAVFRRIETSQANAAAGEVTVVRFLDRKLIEVSQIEELGEELAGLAEAGKTRVMIDFAGVEFLSSAVLSKLLNMHNKLAPVGGQLKLCNLKPALREVFTITRMDRLLDIRPDEAKALASF